MLITYYNNGKRCQREIGAEELRQGRIALANLKLHCVEKGLKLDQDMMSRIGTRIKLLNQIDPTLNLQFDEAVEFVRELVDFTRDRTLRSKRPSSAKRRALKAKDQLNEIRKDLANMTAEFKRTAKEIAEQRDLNDPNLDTGRKFDDNER
jgi:hypothetical protein